MKPPVQQDGYVLLLMLLSVLAGSVAGVSGLSRETRQPAVNAIQPYSAELKNARQALLSYAVNYANLYGPSGAGPGHLPCADTDGSATVSLYVGTGTDDGPDPPCGNNSHSAGNLPRHIKLPGLIYSFHSLPDQRMAYRVSSGAINNPLNRKINPGLAQHHSATQPFVAIASQRIESSGVLAGPLHSTALSYKSLLDVTGPAVAAWFIEHAKDYDELHCPGYTTQEALIALLMDDQDGGDQCGPLVLRRLSIERTPANRHWFIRNEWHQWLRVVVSPECSSARPIPCGWRFLRQASARKKVPGLLYMLWEAVP